MSGVKSMPYHVDAGDAVEMEAFARKFAEVAYHPPLGNRPGERQTRAVEVFNTQDERGKTMGIDNGSKPQDEKQQKRSNLTQQLNGLRAENDGLRRENERLQRQVADTEKLYQRLVDTWNAKEAGLSNATLKDAARLDAQGEMARKLAQKLLRWLAEPEKAADGE